MSTSAKNRGFVKPAQKDFYNVDDFNSEADIIDCQLIVKSDRPDWAFHENRIASVDTKIAETANTDIASTLGSVLLNNNKVKLT